MAFSTLGACMACLALTYYVACTKATVASSVVFKECISLVQHSFSELLALSQIMLSLAKGTVF